LTTVWVVEMDVTMIPLAFGLGIFAFVVLMLGYEMASAWLSWRSSRR